MANEPEPKTEVIAETEQYLVWIAEEPDEETTFHLELNNVTLHFFQEEWDEFMKLAAEAEGPEDDDDVIYDLEYNNIIIHFTAEEWGEFHQLIQSLTDRG